MKWTTFDQQKPKPNQMCKVKYEVWRYHSLRCKEQGEFKYLRWSDTFEEPVFEHYFEDCKIYFTHWKSK